MSARGAAVDPQARLFGLPPVVSRHTVLLILGSFPGVASLEAGQYYAHPRNHFWPLMGDLLTGDAQALAALPYRRRLTVLRQRGIGLWDVYASCVRAGSLDSAIRQAQVNDLAALRRRCPVLAAIAHNGGESHRHAAHSGTLGVPVYRLPSSSPANASWSFGRKLQAWREVFAAHGLV